MGTGGVDGVYWWLEDGGKMRFLALVSRDEFEGLTSGAERLGCTGGWRMVEMY